MYYFYFLLLLFIDCFKLTIDKVFKVQNKGFVLSIKVKLKPAR